MTDYKTIAEPNHFIVLDKYSRDWQVQLVPTLFAMDGVYADIAGVTYLSCVGMHTELNKWVEAAIKLLSLNSHTL